MADFRTRHDLGARVAGKLEQLANATGGVTATASGAVGGILIAHHRGAPVWLLLTAIAGSLVFGLISSSFRPEDVGERKKLIRHNIFNAGALWIIACAIVWTMDLHFSTSMVVALILGLFGTQFLESVEESMVPKMLADKIATWWLGR